MNKLAIRRAHSALKKLSRNRVNARKFRFKFESKFLDYQPFLKDFSSNHYRIFDDIASELAIENSIKKDLVYLFDIFPTIVELLNFKKPDNLDGLSLKDLLLGKEKKIRNSLFFSYKHCCIFMFVK